MKQLQPGQSTEFTLTYSLLKDASAVQKVEQRVKQIQGDDTVEINQTPIATE